MEKLTLSRCKAQALLADPSLNVNCCNCAAARGRVVRFAHGLTYPPVNLQKNYGKVHL